MVVVGVRLTDEPLVTAMAPGLIKPVPFAKFAVSVMAAPEVMVVAEGTKLEINGKANTVRLTVPWTLPDAAVTVTLPGATPVATLLVMAAIVPAEEDQVTAEVTSLVLPSV